jgi:MscS family membrane protein
MERLTDQIGALMRDFGAQLSGWLGSLNWSDIILAAAIVLIVVALRSILARWAVWLVIAVGNSIGVIIAETVKTAITPAIKTLIVSFALLIALEIIDLPETISITLERILISVAIASVFAVAYVLTDPLSRLLEPYRTTSTQIQVDWILRIAKVAVVFLGIAAVLKVWGIDLGPALTGMGLLGAGVALAAQDLFRNLIGGMTNISEKRFGAGDRIRVEGVIEGFVEKVEFRSTQIRRFDKALVHVPNGDLANSPLVNFSRMPHRRIYWMINLVYSTTTEQLAEIREAIEHYIDGSGDFVSQDQAARFVHIDSFDKSAINMLVYCFTKSAEYGEYLEAKEKLVIGIKDAVERAGSAFAFPSRSIYVEAAATAGPDSFAAKGDEALSLEPEVPAATNR